jgi:hypothetical protein
MINYYCYNKWLVVCKRLFLSLSIISGILLSTQQYSKAQELGDSETVATEVSEQDVVIVSDSSESESGFIDEKKPENLPVDSDGSGTVVVDNTASDTEVISQEASSGISISKDVTKSPVQNPLSDVTAEPLKLTSEKVRFTLTEQIHFTFTPEQPFILDKIKDDAIQDTGGTFTDTVVRVAEYISNQLTQGISHVVDIVSNQFADTISFFTNNQENTENESNAIILTPESTTLGSSQLESIESETQNDSNALNIIEDLTQIPSATTVSTTGDSIKEPETRTSHDVHEETQIATVTPVMKENRIAIDDVPVIAEIHVQNEQEVQVEFVAIPVTPGSHRIDINIFVGRTLYHWEGEILIEGVINREISLNNMYRVYVIQSLAGETLWLLDTSVPGYEYTLLATVGMFPTTTPVTYMNNSVFWLSNNGEVLSEYNILGRTMSSQALEENNETPLTRDGQTYDFSVSDDTFTFAEPVVDLLYEPATSF